MLLIKHIVHHRGQINVLMRLTGLKPFGVYGPPKEDWINLGVENSTTLIKFTGEDRLLKSRCYGCINGVHKSYMSFSSKEREK
jgi:hypothetical protein